MYLLQDAQSQANPFFSDEAISPPAMRSNLCISQQSSWDAGAIPRHDGPVQLLPQHNSPLSHTTAHHYREALCGRALQTPRSQSQASTSSGSPHHVAQLDMCGASMAAHMHHAWQGHHPPGNERGHMPLGHVIGQGVYPPDDYRASAYQVRFPVPFLMGTRICGEFAATERLGGSQVGMQESAVHADTNAPSCTRCTRRSGCSVCQACPTFSAPTSTSWTLSDFHSF